MITKAIVEKIISPYQVKVRIPVFDRVDTSSISTSTENLNTATICTLPNCYINIQVGDVVFVGFEDNTYHKAVVLGHLCKQNVETFCNIDLNKVTVATSAELPYNTTVGQIKPQELLCLAGVQSNIQLQLDNITQRLLALEEGS